MSKDSKKGWRFARGLRDIGIGILGGKTKAVVDAVTGDGAAEAQPESDAPELLGYFHDQMQGQSGKLFKLALALGDFDATLAGLELRIGARTAPVQGEIDRLRKVNKQLHDILGWPSSQIEQQERGLID